MFAGMGGEGEKGYRGGWAGAREALHVSHTGAPKLYKSVDEMICFAQTDVGREVGQETRELPAGNILPAISQ